MTRKIFGTDGVRGLANQAPMDPETALALGRALARYFLGKSRKNRIVIGNQYGRSHGFPRALRCLESGHSRRCRLTPA